MKYTAIRRCRCGCWTVQVTGVEQRCALQQRAEQLLLEHINDDHDGIRRWWYLRKAGQAARKVSDTLE